MLRTDQIAWIVAVVLALAVAFLAGQQRAPTDANAPSTRTTTTTDGEAEARHREMMCQLERSRDPVERADWNTWRYEHC